MAVLKAPWTLCLVTLVYSIHTAISVKSGSNATTSALTLSATASTSTDSLTVFYHVFQSGISGGQELSASIVREQLSMAKASSAFGTVKRFNYVFVGPNISSVPALLNCSTCHQLEHKAAGNEVITLQHLFDHCAQNPTGRVLYMHNKGSFHNTPANVVFRRFLTKGVWSDACQNMPLACSACASRFSPLPHHHYPGNMWVARCEYVSRLIPPLEMEAAMERVATTRAAVHWRDLVGQSALVGRGRFSLEHWLSSHPSLVPCDVYDRTDYFWGKTMPRKWRDPGGAEDWTPKLHVFPRQGMPLSEFCQGQAGVDLNLNAVKTWQAFEWQHLYPASPLQSGPLWGYYNQSVGGKCSTTRTGRKRRR
jgi:hypothetical protein